MLRRRKQIFSDYATDILRSSMVTGVPQIAHAANPAKKLIRVLVLFACLTGFIYQSLDFMNLYWQYKTIANAYVEETRDTEDPSFTICNLNGIYRSRICSDPRFMSNCSNFEDYNWCDCSDQRWCNNGTLEDTKVPNSELIEKIGQMDYEDYKMLLQRLDEFIDNCSSDEGSPCDLEHAYHTRCPSRFKDVIESCWTLNTVIGRPEMEPKRINSTEEKILTVFPHVEEYPDYHAVASAYISIHNARQILSPFNHGFRMDPNKVLEFRLKKAVTKLLPAPYETNCVDYIEKWRSRGGYGPTNQRECFDECIKNLSLQFLGCVPPTYGIPSHEKRCSSTEFMGKEPRREIEECRKEHCYPACYEEHFAVEREIVHSTANDCQRPPASNQRITIIITMNTVMETTTYEHSPKFQRVEVFSYIGGYVGIWLGISLVAVFDFLETVILIISYPFKSYKKVRKRKGRIIDVKILTRDL